MNRIAIAGLVLAAGFLACAPSQAGTINGILQVDVCDPTTNQGLNCLKPLADGSLNVNGSFSATLAGFTPGGTVANLAVTTSTANVALPAGVVVAVTNDGASDVSYKLSVGASTAATTDHILKSGATVGLTVGSNTYINAITASGSSHLSMAGGAGLVTGYGGGGSGSGSGDASAANQTVVQAVIGAATAPTKMNAVGGVYNSTPLTLTNGQSSAAQYDANGYQKVNIAAGNGSAIGATTSGQTPSTVACNALSTNPTAATTATTTPFSCDLQGRTVTKPYAMASDAVQGAITSAMTGTTSTSLLAAPGASLYNYITSISCVNSHATVGTLVAVQDGSGGTTMFHLAAASLFGGDNTTFLVPWKQTTANTALYVADVTTGASVTCKATGFKGP